jgi:hypothetical protein
VTDNPARTYQVLREETASLLGYSDLDKLTPTESLRLDLTALLRLQIDTLQGQALSGESIDMPTLSSCVGMLQKLLPASVTEAAASHDFKGAREELLNILNAQASALEAQEEREADRLSGLDVFRFGEELCRAVDQERLVVGQRTARVIKAQIDALRQVIAEKDAVIASLGGKVVARSPAPKPEPPTAPAAVDAQPPSKPSHPLIVEQKNPERPRPGGWAHW